MPTEPLFLDVRPLIAAGGHPLDAINAEIGRLTVGQSFRLLAPFRPEPLFRMLSERGFDAHPVDQPNGDCEVLFTPRDALPEIGDSIPSPLVWPDPLHHFDLTELDDVSSARRTLQALDGMPEGAVLFVLFAREPEFLYSDLTRRNHRWVGNFDSSGEIYRMLIRRG